MRSLPLIVLFFALAGVACSDANDLPDATIENFERTDTLWALLGTPVSTPSGYSVQALAGSRRVRTDLSVDFDFAYNVEPDGEHVFLPRAALGIDTANTVNPGFVLRNESFEAITMPPGGGYITDSPVPLAVGQRYVVRSRVTCAGLGVPRYAKMEILEFDDVARIVTFRILANDNCGFRSLEPGLPDR
jgi:hypothetical protein